MVQENMGCNKSIQFSAFFVITKKSSVKIESLYNYKETTIIRILLINVQNELI